MQMKLKEVLLIIITRIVTCCSTSELECNKETKCYLCAEPNVTMNKTVSIVLTYLKLKWSRLVFLSLVYISSRPLLPCPSLTICFLSLVSIRTKFFIDLVVKFLITLRK